ncbi:MAG: zinc ribbon domain-containing protein [Candidatus Bathyarchaeia archaeon]
MSYCPNCVKKTPADAAFCPSCGASLTAVPPPPPSTLPPPPPPVMAEVPISYLI